jgi:hypothetical protein
MYRLLPILALVASLGCNSSDDFTPTEPSPGGSIPSIGGTYTSPTMWQFTLTAPTSTVSLTCAGSLTIATQIGESFNGTYLISDAACGQFAGTFANGVWRSDNTVTLELQFADGTMNFLAQLFGCTYVSGDRAMNGTLVGRQLDTQARTELDCNLSQSNLIGRTTQVVRLAGNR